MWWALITLFVFLPQNQPYSIGWSSFGCGGGFASSEMHSITSTCGQSMIGECNSPNHRVNSGFWAICQLQVGIVENKWDEQIKYPVLYQNSPSPFSTATSIKFLLPKESLVTLTVYDALGRTIRTLLYNRILSVGPHLVTWNGCNDSGERLSSGVYFYRLRVDGFEATKKLVLINH